jgi:hypothetical protein
VNLKLALLDISLLVRQHHSLGLRNLPAWKLRLLEVGKHGTNTLLQLLEVDVVGIQLKNNFLDKGAAAKVATVENFITVVVRLSSSGGSV